MRPFGLGPTELIVILAIVLLLFGPKQLPKLSRMFGKAMKDMKDGLEGKGGAEEDEVLPPGKTETEEDTVAKKPEDSAV